MDESKQAQEKFWNERYVKENLFGEEPNFFIKSHEDLIKKHKKALCLADGQGRNGVYIAKLGLDVTSIDVSPLGIEAAKKFAKQQGVEDKYHTIQEDILSYELKDTFDLVVICFCQFTKEHKKLHQKLSSLLVKGGVVLLIGYHYRQLEYKTGGWFFKYLLFRSFLY